MTGLRVSVVVVSRGRPKSLHLCLTAISQLFYDNFELVVVADAPGLAVVRASVFAGNAKTYCFEDPNISVARNLGIARATGDIVAFVDDDAVPEPGWLRHLAAVFEDGAIAAAGGYVRGRNGISFQYCGKMVDVFGASTPLQLSGNAPVVFDGSRNRAPKTVGTNCAFRRDVLASLGGFNPAFAYYLDEAELNIRIAKAGLKTAIVPLAQVHHHRAASVYRAANGMPHSLYQIGASVAALLRIHAPDFTHKIPISRARAVQRNRLLSFVVSGACEPREVHRMLKTFDAGVADGQIRTISTPAKIQKPSTKFVKFCRDGASCGHLIVSGFRIHHKSLCRKAKSKTLSGFVVSLYSFSRTSFYHRVRFHPDGFWEQCGGLFGRAGRSELILSIMTLAKRVEKEDRRVAAVRHP